MHYLVITTGSCGNCYIFTTGRDTIIIDDGVTYKKITDKMAERDIDIATVRALFLTHLHPDHSKGVGVLQRKLGIPVYISSVSRERNENLLIRQKIERDLLRTFEFGEKVDIPGFSVTSFPTSHDSDGSAGYAFQSEGVNYFLMTDTGVIPQEAWEYSRSAKVKFIEANYDEDMLESGPYPEFLKNRIRGNFGHLSNQVAMDFAKSTSNLGDSLYFVHLSANNNAPSIVRKLAEKTIPSGIFCKVCERGELFEGFLDGKEEKDNREGMQKDQAS